MKNNSFSEITQKLSKTDGAVLPPLILWLLGVPGFIVILLWLFVFRG